MKLLNQIDAKSLIIGVLLTLVVTLAMGARDGKEEEEWDKLQKWTLMTIPLKDNMNRYDGFVTSEIGGVHIYGYAPFCILDDKLVVKRPMDR